MIQITTTWRLPVFFMIMIFFGLDGLFFCFLIAFNQTYYPMDCGTTIYTGSYNIIRFALLLNLCYISAYKWGYFNSGKYFGPEL